MMKSVMKATMFSLLLMGVSASALEIGIPEKAAPFEVTARDEMKSFLEKTAEAIWVDGTEIRTILLGETPQAVAAGLTRSGMKTDSFVIRRNGDQILINGGGTRGVLYGTYEFLKGTCGIRFFSPVMTHIPPRRVIRVKSVDATGDFYFPMRDIYISAKVLPLDGGRFAIANGLSRDGDRKISQAFGGAFDYGPPYSCHTFNHYIPAEKYLKSHPEYFSLRNGKRVGGQNLGQLCLTNPELRKVFAEKLLANIRETTRKAAAEDRAAPLIYDVSHNDNSNCCQCPSCSAFAQRENQSGVMIDFLNYLADCVKPEFPDVRLQFFAYQYNSEPPKSIRARDNVIVRICNTGSNQITGCAHDPVVREKFQRWRKCVSSIYVWDYGITYGDLTGAPYPSEFFYPDTFKFYAENGASGMFWELEAPDRSDMWELKYFLLSKYMANPRRTDFEALLDDFYGNCYGAAGKHVLEYRRILLETARRRQAVIGWFASPVDFSYIGWSDMRRMQEAMAKARRSVEKDSELLFRVNRAGMGLDRLLGFEYLPRYKREGAGENVAAMASEARIRFWTTWSESIRRTSTIDMRTHFERLQGRCENILRLPDSPKVEPLQGMNTLDFFAPDVATIGNNVQLEPDPDSEYGSSVKIIADMSRVQKFPQSCGIYSLSQSKEIRHWELPEKLWKKDQWQWLELKDVQLPAGENCYVYFTNSWVVQILLAYLAPLDRTRPFDIRFHVKLGGDRFFHDGKPSYISIDRVMLCQPKNTK